MKTKGLKTALSSMVSVCLLCTTAFAQISGVQVTGGNLDRAFDQDRTLYYVTSENINTLPVITAEGGNTVQTASDFNNNNVTVISDAETGKSYRFVFNAYNGSINIESLLLSATGVLSINGSTVNNLDLMILKSKVERGGEAYEISDIDLNNAENNVLDTVTIPAGTINFNYQFPNDTKSGTYSFVFGSDKLKKDKYVIKTIYFATQEDLNTALIQINSAASLNDISTTILNNCNLLQISESVYKSIVDKNLYFTTFCGKAFTDMGIVIDLARKTTALSVINQTTADNVLSVVNDYKAILETNLTSIYPQVLNKKNVAEMIKQNNYETSTEFNKRFDKCTSTQLINEAEPAQMSTKLESVMSYFELNSELIAKYNNINDKTRVYKALTNKSFTNPEDLVAAFTSSVNEGEPVIEPVTTGGNNNSSGGGGSTYIKVNTDKDVVEPVEPTVEPDVEKPAQSHEETKIFKDIDDVEWAKEAILLLHDWEVINGKSEGVFAPNDNVTREEFTKMLLLAMDFSISKDKLSFNDVKDDEWYYDYISSALKAGIVKGVSEEQFGIGSNITRQDMAVMLSRAIDSAKITVGSSLNASFSDSSEIADYAKAAVERLAKAGIVNGVGENKFAPNETLTRAMAAQVIYNVIKNL